VPEIPQVMQPIATNPVVAGGQTSASTQQRLPIRVHLDLSDEKSLSLFIYRQKYNMKKNEYFNLERRNLTLEK